MNYAISKEPINVQEVIDKVVQREAGAITTFIGTVRELTHGKKTLYLIYEKETRAMNKSGNQKTVKRFNLGFRISHWVSLWLLEL